MARSQRPDLTQSLRRMSDANLRYYQGWGQLALDYLSSLVALAGELTQPSRSVGTHVHPEPSAADLTRSEPMPVRSAAPTQPPAMVLEADGGGQAVGAFLVENRLTQRVSTPVVASTFVGPEGQEVRPHLSLDPEIVTLDPGEQVLVRVISLIDDRLEPGITYRASVSVPGLGGRNLPLVLRRRVESAVAASVALDPAAGLPDAGGPVSSGPRKRRPATRRKAL